MRIVVDESPVDATQLAFNNAHILTVRQLAQARNIAVQLEGELAEANRVLRNLLISIAEKDLDWCIPIAETLEFIADQSHFSGLGVTPSEVSA